MAIEKLNNGKWRAYPYYKKMLPTKTFNTKAEAEAYEFKAISTARGIQYTLDEIPLEHFTLANLCEYFLAYQLDRVDPEGHRRYAIQTEYIRHSPIADKSVRSLTPDDIDRLIDYWNTLPTAKDTKRTSFKKEIELVRSMFNIYKDRKRDQFFHSPLLKSHMEKSKGNWEKPKKKSLTTGGVLAWFEALKNRPNPTFYHLAYVMIHTGLRRGEALGLTAKCLDFNTKTIHIKQQIKFPYNGKGRKPILSDKLKTKGSIREIPMSKGVEQILKTYMRLNPFPTDENPYGLIFWYQKSMRGRPTDDTLIKHCIAKNVIYKNFTKAFEDANLNLSGTHVCRRTFISLGASKHSLEILQKAVGHSKLSTTEGYFDNDVLPIEHVGESIEKLLAM